MKKQSLYLFGIGLFCIAIAAGTLYWGGERIGRLQMIVSDWFVVRADGLRLGARPVRDDIVLVLLDLESAKQRGGLIAYDKDVQLYKQLLDSGATVIYDTRLLAAAEKSVLEEFQPMLDAMLEMDSSGRLKRDLILSPALLAETEGRYRIVSAPNVIRTRPHSQLSQQARLCPLIQVSGDELCESAQLQMMRFVLGMASTSSIEIAKELKRSGIFYAWHQEAPDLIPASDFVRPTPYRMGDSNLRWYPFSLSTSMVPPAGFWVSYDVDISGYLRLPISSLMKGESIPEVKDKIVIIGLSSESDILDDAYSIPSRSTYASTAEVFACSVQTLLDGREMRELPQWLHLAMIAAACLVAAQICGTLRPTWAMMVSLGLLVAYWTYAVGMYRAGWFSDFALTPLFAILSGTLGLVYSAGASIRSRQRVVELFGRYVPRAVVNQLMLKPDLQRLTIGGVRRDVSVLFADIRGFTSFSEDLPPELVVQQLNSLLEIMVACTFENEGTLDKFIGDAILVLFNAPVEQDDHVDRALRTAIAIQKRLKGHATGLRVGIGVHRGDAVVGNIGTQQRLEYTAIGSTVNIASRLCSLAQPGEIVLSRELVAQLPAETVAESMGLVQVKGIKQSLEAYRVTALD